MSNRRRPHLMAGAAALAVLSVATPARSQALPTGGTVVQGSNVDFRYSPNGNGNGGFTNIVVGDPAQNVIAGAGGNDKVLQVRVGDAASIINWNSFNIASGNTVSFTAQAGFNAAFAVLNRVGGNTPSSIQGTLTGGGNTATGGSIWLINPNGILFGPNSSVTNMASFVAAALDVSNSDFNKFAALPAAAPGDPTTADIAFTGTRDAVTNVANASGSIVLQSGAASGPNAGPGASIAVNGFVLLAAPDINIDDTRVNRPAIQAGSDIGLVLAQDASIRLDEASLLRIGITEGTNLTGARILAGGTLNGARVYAVAASRQALTESLLNVSGSVTATHATATENGIVLRAGVADPGPGGPISMPAAPLADSNAANRISVASNALVAAGSGIDIAANGAVAFANLAAGGGISVQGASVDIGSGGMSAAGAIRVAATGGSITTNGGTIAANTGNADYDALALRGITLTATGSIGTAANGPALTTGSTAAKRNDVTVTVGAAGTVTLGDITVRNLSVDASTAGQAGAITLGDITANKSLSLTNTGAISLGTVASGGDIGLTAGAALGFTGLTAVGKVTASAATGVDIGAGGIAAVDGISVAANGGAITTNAGTIASNTGNADYDALALRGITLTATGSIGTAAKGPALTTGSTTAKRNDVTVTVGAAGTVTLGDITARNLNVDASTAGQAGAVRLGAVNLGGDLTAANAALMSIGSITSPGSVSLTSGGALTTGNLDGAAGYALQGSSVTVTDSGALAVSSVGATNGAVALTAAGALTATGAITASGGNVGLSGSGLTVKDVGATGAITLTSAGAVAADSIRARGGITITGGPTSVTAQRIEANGAIAITTGGQLSVTDANGLGTRPLLLNAALTSFNGAPAAAANITVSAGSYSLVTGAAATGNISLTQTGAAALDLSALALDASQGNLSITNSGGDISLGGTGSLSLKDDLVIDAGANTVRATANLAGNNLKTITVKSNAVISGTLDLQAGDISVKTITGLAGSGDITLTASTGNLATGTIRTDLAAGSTARLSLSATSAGKAITTAAAAEYSAAGDVSLAGTVTAGGALLVTSGGTATIGGGVTTAAGDYVVRARAVTVGTAGQSLTQKAAGGLLLRAANGNVTLNGTMSLEAGSGNLVIDADGAAGTIVAAAPNLKNSSGAVLLLRTDSAAVVSLGTVQARSLAAGTRTAAPPLAPSDYAAAAAALAFGGDLQITSLDLGSTASISSGGDMTLGTATSTAGLTLTAGGLLRAGSINVGGDASLFANGASGSLALAKSVTVNGAALTGLSGGVTAGGNITLFAKGNINVAGDVAGSGNLVTLDAGSNAVNGTLTVQGDISANKRLVAIGDAVSVQNITAKDDLVVVSRTGDINGKVMTLLQVTPFTDNAAPPVDALGNPITNPRNGNAVDLTGTNIALLAKGKAKASIDDQTGGNVAIQGDLIDLDTAKGKNFTFTAKRITASNTVTADVLNLTATGTSADPLNGIAIVDANILGSIALTSASDIVVTGNLKSTNSGITLTALDGKATLTGTTATPAGNDVIIRAGSIELGLAGQAAITQAAGGGALLYSKSGDINFVSPVTVQGSGGPVVIDAAGSIIGSTTLIGGVAGARTNVLVRQRSAGALTLGDVTANQLATIATPAGDALAPSAYAPVAGAILTNDAAITLGNIRVAGDLAVTSVSGTTSVTSAISSNGGVSLDGGVDLLLGAAQQPTSFTAATGSSGVVLSADRAIIGSGTLTVSGPRIDLLAGVIAPNAGPAPLRTQSIALGGASFTTAGAFTVTALTSGFSGLTLGNVNAGSIAVANLGQVPAAGVAGPITVRTLTSVAPLTLASTSGDVSVIAATVTGAGNSLAITGATALSIGSAQAAGDVRLTATAGQMSIINQVTAGNDIVLSAPGGSMVATGPLAAARDLTATARDTLSFRWADGTAPNRAGRTFDARATNTEVRQVSVTGNLKLTASGGDLIVPDVLRADGTVDLSGNLRVGSATPLGPNPVLPRETRDAQDPVNPLDPINGTPPYSVSIPEANLPVWTPAQNLFCGLSLCTINGGSVTLGNIVGGGDLVLNAASVDARSVLFSAGSIQMRSNSLLDVRVVQAATGISLSAGTDILVGVSTGKILSAPTTSLRSTGASLVKLDAGGTIRLGTSAVSGGAIALTAGINGPGSVIAGSALVATDTALSAGADITVAAATDVDVRGLTTAVQRTITMTGNRVLAKAITTGAAPGAGRISLTGTSSVATGDLTSAGIDARTTAGTLAISNIVGSGTVLAQASGNTAIGDIDTSAASGSVTIQSGQVGTVAAATSGDLGVGRITSGSGAITLLANNGKVSAARLDGGAISVTAVRAATAAAGSTQGDIALAGTAGVSIGTSSSVTLLAGRDLDADGGIVSSGTVDARAQRDIFAGDTLTGGALAIRAGTALVQARRNVTLGDVSTAAANGTVTLRAGQIGSVSGSDSGNLTLGRIVSGSGAITLLANQGQINAGAITGGNSIITGGTGVT
ncbi:MAG: filamentous hemagglutinin N-terminal domain-containing protein, partial [Sphingomonadales bacterium]